MNNSTSQPGSSTSGTFVTSSKYTNNANLSTHQREVETELMPAPMGPIITGQMASEFFKKSDQNQQQSQSQNNLQGQGPGPGGQRQNSQQSQQKTLHFVQQGSQSGTMVSQSGSMVSQSVSIVSQSGPMSALVSQSGPMSSMVSQSGPMSSLVSQSGSMSSLISQAGSLASQAGSMGSSQSGSAVNLHQHEEKASFSDIDDLFPSMNNYQPGVVSATLECDATANQYQTQLFDQAGQQIDQNRQIDQNTTELDQFLLSINASTTSASTSSQQQNQQAKK